MLNQSQQRLAYNYSRLYLEIEMKKITDSLEGYTGSGVDVFKKKYELLEKNLEELNKANVFSRPKVEDFDSIELANLIDEFIRAKGLSLEDSIEYVIETLKSEG